MLTLAVLALSLHAAEPRPAPEGVTPAPPARVALTQAAAVGVTAATAVLSVLSGWLVPRACWEAEFRGNPMCAGVGLLIGAGVQVGLALLLVPETFRLANDPGGAGDVGVARAEAWRKSRWAALAGLAFVATFLVGAAVEQRSYGHGQAAMLVGALGALGSGVTFDVLQLLGASAGYQGSRRASP